MLQAMNDLARRGVPFLFIIDFEQQKPIILPLEEAARHGIYFNIKGLTNWQKAPLRLAGPIQNKYPPPFAEYEAAFHYVRGEIKAGNSYLVNLTFPTRIDLAASPEAIFRASPAPYKLLYRDELVVFSPECFVRIDQGNIYTFPMKGTIDANLPNAAQMIMEDPKERAEHYTIVDLLRNDLNTIAVNIEVEDFRYLDRINTSGKDLLQVSSRIVGRLEGGYETRIGEIIQRLLPAGSISGAPKDKTVEIIQNAESGLRGYYTGIFGYYDNGRLDSGIMIRYIERQGKDYYFRSGGGITASSVAEKEYQELIDKVYVPVDRND